MARSASMAANWRAALASMAVALLLLGAAPRVAAQAIDDPLEPLNRAVFQFNLIVDNTILKPVTQLYGFAVPDPAKRGVTNFLQNLRAPIVFANQVLQGEREQAGITLGRFMVNTTFGLFGLVDFANYFGIPPREEADFGQTLGVYGIGAGPYLVLPLLGPSTVRDATGIAVDSFIIDPTIYFTDTSWRLARFGLTAVDTRYRYGPLIDDLQANSLDFYVAARSAFLQNREAQIRKNGGGLGDEYESIFDDSFDEEASDDPFEVE